MVSLRAFWGEKGQNWAKRAAMKTLRLQWELWSLWGGIGGGSIGGPQGVHKGSIWGSGAPYGVTVP